MIDNFEDYIDDSLDEIRDIIDDQEMLERFNIAALRYTNFSALAIMDPKNAERHATNAKHALASIAHLKAESGIVLADRIQDAVQNAISIGFAALGLKAD